MIFSTTQMKGAGRNGGKELPRNRILDSNYQMKPHGIADKQDMITIHPVVKSENV